MCSLIYGIAKKEIIFIQQDVIFFFNILFFLNSVYYIKTYIFVK